MFCELWNRLQPDEAWHTFLELHLTSSPPLGSGNQFRLINKRQNTKSHRCFSIAFVTFCALDSGIFLTQRSHPSKPEISWPRRRWIRCSWGLPPMPSRILPSRSATPVARRSAWGLAGVWLGSGGPGPKDQGGGWTNGEVWCFSN